MNKMKLIRIFAANRLWSHRKTLLTRVRRLLWAAALLLPAFAAQADVVFTNLYSFQPFPNGESPAGLIQGSDGYFYGTTSQGGANNAGTVFKISTNGMLTSLYSFTGRNDGANPYGLVQGTDGYFYGTTSQGGANNAGTVFKLSTNGTLTTLYSFANDGGYLGGHSGLVQGTDGCFYGTTEAGGTNGVGSVFKITSNGALTSLYSFTGGNDGYLVVAGLVQGSDGYFYGTTEWGGTYDGGTIFKISRNGTLTSLHSFTGGNEGLDPISALVEGNDGFFYGTTEGGGSNSRGTVFKITHYCPGKGRGECGNNQCLLASDA